MTLWEFLMSQGVNEAPGMGSQANAGGFTSGQMRDQLRRDPPSFGFDDYTVVPGYGQMPQGMPGTPGGPAPQRGMTADHLRQVMMMKGGR